MLIVVIHTWATLGANALSVILFILSVPAVAIFAAMGLFFLVLLKPLAEAVLNLILEEMRCCIWEGFGCHRGPEKIRECEEAVERKAYCLSSAVEPFKLHKPRPE